MDDKTKNEIKTAPKPSHFNGIPVPNALALKNGIFCTTLKIQGDKLPEIGDEITVSYGKAKYAGVVRHILTGNIVAINSQK